LGHAWEENAILPERAARCPVCGIIVPWPPDGIVPTSSSREDAGPTVMQSTDWHAGAGTVNEAPPSLADFEILGELGRGGMGMVYKARWRSQNRTVALKIIRQDRLQHDEAVRRFRREAQAAARLHHPNIVQVFDSDHSGDTHYLVMEYVDGVTLDRLVEEKGALPIPQACDYIRQAAYGLQHAHEQALVHRDIKPANLMVVSGGVVSGDNPKGSKTRPGASDSPTHQAPSTKHQTPLTIGPLTTHQIKILDMGVARVLHLTGGGSSGESLSTLTQGGAVIGTADFIAPEQLEDPHGADIRADLYSLGCTFYFLLTGHVPFPGGSLVSKLDKQRWQAPTPVDELRLDIPVAVAGVVRKLLAKKPADRFRTPGELAHALEELAQGGYTDAARARLTIEEARRLAGPTSAEAAVAIAANG
jgi:serine/threonine protein kinase